MAAAILLFGIVEEAVLYGAFPTHYTAYTLLIAPYFLLLAWMVTAMERSMERHGTKPQTKVMRWLQLTMAQLLLTVVLLLIYVVCIDVERVAFLLTFCIFYLWYMCVKMYTLHKIQLLESARKAQTPEEPSSESIKR